MKHDNDNHTLTYLSVCSGIEAASVAWHPLGWRAVGYSEIEKFPSAVLAHHYPDVPNLGDFTKIDTSALGQVDILAGGTPCQAFSVAGLRQGLDDARGNLTLKFVELAHELADGNGLRNVVWENVVGVLSDKGNAFGCFLAGLVGADDPIVPPGRWTNAGMVSGPRGRAAWRVLDAQYFGVAQRRRRVIVVADFGNGADPAAVLLIEQGLPRHPPARGETGKDVAGAAASGVGGGGGLGTDFDLDGGLATPAYSIRTAQTGSNGWGVTKESAYTLDRANGQAVYAPEIARCDATREGSSQDYETTTMVAVASIHADSIGRTGEAITPSADAGGLVRLRNPGMGVIDDGTTYNLMASGSPHAVCVTGDITHTLKAEGADASEGGTGRGTPIIAFTAKDYGADACVELSPTRRAGGFTGSHANGGVMPAITVAIRGRDGGATAELGGPVATALRASQGGGDKPHVLTSAVIPIDMRQASRGATMTNNRTEGQSGGAPGTGIGKGGDPAPTISTSHPVAAFTGSAVRRLTPMECERLQGFQWLCSPDYPGAWQDEAGRWWSPDYTAIPWRGKPADQCPDGPRYKSLGNSWAVPKFEWLGRRIQMLMPAAAAENIKEAA